MKLWGSRTFGRLAVSWHLSNIPHPVFAWGWEVESMWFGAGIGDGHSDEIVCFCFYVPAPIVRLINRVAGY